MEQKIIQPPTYVNTPGQIRIDFLNPDFDILVDNKGYDVVWERAIPCPCGKRMGTNLSSCQNCLGTGWVFINPTEIKAIAQSINKTTKFKEWSLELLGTASFTVRSNYRLNFMDKITILNSSSPQSENKVVQRIGTKLFVNLIYPGDSIIEIFKFQSPTKPLQLLTSDQYTLQNNYVIFGGNIKEGDSLTITYMHKVQYHILDLNHDVRNTILLNNESREFDINLPISAIGRRADIVINAQNITEDNILNNSYL